ncbi:hypothetical protein ACVBIL_04230 [Shewanella sp. 125m-7]
MLLDIRYEHADETSLPTFSIIEPKQEYPSEEKQKDIPLTYQECGGGRRVILRDRESLL